ncbi:zinc-ribbon and DUF3426 domain-containing protein [Tepidimonas sp.]|uniref:zinc-ribbon and DUF3426 domain-containing protein n=1 Tax=Tepidimonas sp. TaxID=2002775 RepID=UPI002FE3E100
MSFITRCPSCGTAFRVVADQLKIASGWVRCGRCQHIFDATLDLQPAQPPAGGRPMPTGASAAPAPPAADVATTAAQVPAMEGAPSSVSMGDVTRLQAAETQSVGEAATVAASAPSIDADAARDGLAAPQAAVGVASGAGEASEPSFVRQARRRAFWRRPLVRALLALGVLALAAGLLAQVAWIWRDEWVVRYPAARPALQAWCSTLGCQINPPRRAQDVLIEASVLLRRAPDRYSFHLVLRNQAEVALQAPALELTLIDAQERVLVRRVWQPHEWPQPTDTLAPRSEWPLQFELLFDHPQAARMTGYRAVLFYP